MHAYQAPYKDKFRCWTALMLIVRSILLVGYGLNVLGDSYINHLTVTVLSILLCCIWVTGIVYKITALSIIEASFILNLLILSGSTIYNRHASNGDSNDGQTASAQVLESLSVPSFASCCTILTFTSSPQNSRIFQEKQNQEWRHKDEWGSGRVCCVCCWCPTSPSSYSDCDRAERTIAQRQLKSWQLVSWLQNSSFDN